MTETYCGNNAQDPELVAGNRILGTPYGCLRKGIGVGLNQPYDPSYLGAYMPIDQRRVYCGNQPAAPDGYDRIGSLPHCLQKGVGIGKRQRAERGAPRFRVLTRYALPSLIFLVLSGGLFTALYLLRPHIVTRKDPDGVDRIDPGRLAAVFVPSTILMGILIYLLWKRIVLPRF